MKLSGVIFILLAIMAGPGDAYAEEGGVPLPTPSKAVKGEKCVEPANVMRREHMNFLTHQRDETLREGIRGKKYSLRQCTECHATADPEIAEGKVRTLQPFCGECHEYVAVKLDCFACHNPTLPLQENSTKSTDAKSDSAQLERMILSHLDGNVYAGTGLISSHKELSQ